MSHVSDEQISALLDGELSMTSRAAVIEHLEHCTRCAARHDALIDVVASLRVAPSVEWSGQSTLAVVGRLGRRHPELVLPLAGVALAATLGLVVVNLAFVGAGLSVAGGILDALDGLTPGATPTGAVAAAVLAVIAFAGAALSLGLARWR